MKNIFLCHIYMYISKSTTVSQQFSLFATMVTTASWKVNLFQHIAYFQCNVCLLMYPNSTHSSLYVGLIFRLTLLVFMNPGTCWLV